MILYLTYNDAPSGIFSSQVIDVVKFIENEFKTDIILVSFISLRNFFVNRDKIKAELPRSIVLPMFPGVHRWEKNIFLLALIAWIKRPNIVIGRGVLAAKLALNFKKKRKALCVVYDGRGAIAAEWKEYGVITNKKMLEQIDDLERQVINNSDFRISVSQELLKLWKYQYGYYNTNHVIIPCTLNKAFETIDLSLNFVKKSRDLLGLVTNDILFVYSGSVAGWQSFELLYDFMKPVLHSNTNIKLLFLSDLDANIVRFQTEFPGQIISKKVNPTEVPVYLAAGDYGLLIREETITNLVASPVKFAEYLACGLQVIISDKLGDYSAFVSAHNCGYLFNQPFDIEAISIDQKIRNNKLALKSFTKGSFVDKYREVITVCP